MKTRLRLVTPLLALICAVGAILLPSGVEANHPVLVEGNCLTPPAGSSPTITPGTCGDYDGDGRIGTAEDTDGDRVFGTINAAIAATGPTSGTANQNGRVLIVTSGTFAEVVNITGANGNVQLDAAPGVDANIDAVLFGDMGNAGRQASPGIIVNAPTDRHVIIRNIVSRNWTIGIDVRGDSHVFIDNCRIENNTNWGVRVQDNARVKINNTQVAATGFRVGQTGDFPRVLQPMPGVGIEYEDNSSGLVCNTCVTRSFGAGIKNSTERRKRVTLENVCLFDNKPNTEGFRGHDDDRR